MASLLTTELRDAGAVFMRTGPSGTAALGRRLDRQGESASRPRAAKAGMYCLPWLNELSAIEPGDKKAEAASPPGDPHVQGLARPGVLEG